MKKNNIGYLLREGIRGIFLHGFMSFAAIWVTVACLLIIGTFGLVLFNLNEMILELEQENAMLVYIDDTYSEAEAKSVGSQINMIANVHNAEFISREEALESFIEEQQDEDLFAVWSPPPSGTGSSSPWRTTPRCARPRRRSGPSRAWQTSRAIMKLPKASRRSSGFSTSPRSSSSRCCWWCPC